MDNIYWTMQNGKRILVDNMTVEHLRNTLKMIIRNKKPIPRKAKFVLNGDMANEFNNEQELAQYEFDIDLE